MRSGNEACPHCMLQADMQRIQPEILVTIDAMLQQNRRQEAREIAQAALKISPRRATFLLDAHNIRSNP